MENADIVGVFVFVGFQPCQLYELRQLRLSGFGAVNASYTRLTV